MRYALRWYDFRVEIRWTCPYKTCGNVNIEHDIDYYDLVSDGHVTCGYCGRGIKVIDEYIKYD